ncbi:unnamed protein product [Lota lota]
MMSKSMRLSVSSAALIHLAAMLIGRVDKPLGICGGPSGQAVHRGTDSVSYGATSERLMRGSCVCASGKRSEPPGGYLGSVPLDQKLAWNQSRTCPSAPRTAESLRNGQNRNIPELIQHVHKASEGKSLPEPACVEQTLIKHVIVDISSAQHSWH